MIKFDLRLNEIFIVSVGQLIREQNSLGNFVLMWTKQVTVHVFLSRQKKSYSSLDKNLFLSFLFNLTEKNCFCQFFFSKKAF